MADRVQIQMRPDVTRGGRDGRYPYARCYPMPSYEGPASYICCSSSFGLMPLSFICCMRYALYCDSDIAVPSGLVGSGCEIAHSWPCSDLSDSQQKSSHLYSRCRVSASRRANFLPQPSHSNGRRPSCRSMCRLQSCWRAKPTMAFGQPSYKHLYGRSSLCDRM